MTSHLTDRTLAGLYPFLAGERQDADALDRALLESVRQKAGESVEVTPSKHPKCERCWHFRADIGAVTGHPTICGRCAGNLSGKDEKRVHA